MTLTEFLLARIEEDEAEYAAAAEAEAESCRNDGIPDMTAEDVKGYWTTVPTRWPRHLAECEAKRLLLESHRPEGEPIADLPGMDYQFCSTCRETGPEAQAWPCDTLKTIAAVYANHEAYRPEWAL